ncbi:hypothetical protein HYS50_00570 [Candidatus Woesearchaeota archaeon]|nr:hypothetical protein [Candidatus Woesearchaeota archaeon]
MKNLKTIIRASALPIVGLGSYFLLRAGYDAYHSPAGETIRESPFPLLGFGAAATFALATREGSKRGFWSPAYSIGLGTLLGGAITSAWRWGNQVSQYAASALNSQKAGVQFLEDMVGVGLTMGALYGACAAVMNACEGIAKWRAKRRTAAGGASRSSP